MNTLRKFLVVALVFATLACGIGFTASPTDAAGPNPVVIFETSMGRIIVMLYPKETPITVANFLKYVDAGFYDGTLFHRVVRQEITPGKTYAALNVVQGGGYVPPLQMKNTLPPIPCESSKGLVNKKGTIAMARADNPASATSQFFFNVKDNPVLDYQITQKEISSTNYEQEVQMGYCAFGKVLRGMDVVEKMHQVKTKKMGGMEDVPAEPIYITKAYRAK